MKPTIKVAFVFNNTNWSSIKEKVQWVVDFFGSDFVIEPTIFHTNFVNIPFIQVNTIGGITNTPGTTNTVEQYWYDKNISLLQPNADIVLFYIDKADIPPMQTSVGICQGRYMPSGPIQTCIFGINETDNAYQYINGEEVEQGNACAVFMAHEVSHALYLIQKKPDNTHVYFYSGQAIKVLDDLKTGELTSWYQLLAYCKQAILLLTTAINQQKIMQAPKPVDPTPEIPANIPQGYTSHPMIYKWAKAVQKAEDYVLPGGKFRDGTLAPNGSLSFQNKNPGNIKYASLAKSWGATIGPKAKDGGYFAKWETIEQGFQALVDFLTLGAENQLLSFHQARTLISFTKAYAGNPPASYYELIFSELGVSGETDISSFLS